MSNSSVRILIGFVGSLILALTTLHMTVASRVDGRYLPVGHDAFYHASRILDAVETGRIAQFDPKMHAPEGDWVTWPWAYDALLASVVRKLQPLSWADPMTVAAHLPPVLGIIGVWLVLAAATLARLPMMLVATAVACFALHAFSQYQFGVGALDHHGAEQLAVLAALVAGMWWLRSPHDARRAALLGVVLGLSLGVHASLVVMQLPLLATLALHWIRRDPLPIRSTAGAAGGLVAGALLILLPAETFWQGRFDLYYLSGLQLYACMASSLVMMALARWPFSRRAVVGIGALVVVLAIPLMVAMRFTAAFIAGDLPAITQIDEIRSPFAFLGEPHGLRRLNQVYTLLIWAAPLVCLASAWMLCRERDASARYFWMWSIAGLVAVMTQARLGSLGVVFLYLSLLVLGWRALAGRAMDRNRLTAVLIAVLAVAYLPTVIFQLPGNRIPSMDQNFSTARSILPGLVAACRARPGLVLASPGDGHIVRFFTECAVIGNNFRLTSTDIEKVELSLRLIGQPAAVLPCTAPEVDYVLARLIPPAESPNPVLFDELLNPRGATPAGFRRIVQAGVTQPDGRRRNFLGVFEVVTQSPTSSPDTSTAETSSPIRLPPSSCYTWSAPAP